MSIENDVIIIDGVVTMTAERYGELIDAEDKLEALDSAGVDNWSGYGYAMEILHGEDG